MNDILFYALLIVLIYYFFIYLPQQKKLVANSNAQQKITELETQLQTQQATITNLENQLTNHPAQPELNDAESLITNLLHSMKQLNNSLK